MPKISEFFGIAIYGGEQATVLIEGLSVLNGRLSHRALGLVMEWAALHQEELMEVWSRAQNLEPLGRIDPLK